MKLDPTDWTVLAGVGLGVGFVVYLISSVKKGTEKVVDTIAEPIADAILAVTLPGQVRLVGRVILPNGYEIPLNDVRPDSSLRFRYGGLTYQIVERNGDAYFARVVA
jgi:hypothetical protein